MKKIKSQFPRNRARKYQAYILETLRDLHAYIRRVLFPRLDDLNPNVNRDTWSNDLEAILLAIEAYAQAFPDERRTIEEARAVAVQIAVAKQAVTIATPNAFGLTRPSVGAFPSLGVKGARTQERNEAILQAWARENARLITGMRLDETDKIAGIVTRGFTSGESLATIKGEIRKQFGISERRAKLIAQNEMGNLAGALEKKEAEELGIRYYEWLTSNDERVRPRKGASQRVPSHRALEGKICRWDDPTVYKDSLDDPEWKPRSAINAEQKHPGQAIRCRCTSASIIED
jgi:SPP1 gp7 family putative phage head morphogenesis protein